MNIVVVYIPLRVIALLSLNYTVEQMTVAEKWDHEIFVKTGVDTSSQDLVNNIIHYAV